MSETFDQALERNAAAVGAGPRAPESESVPTPLGERVSSDMGAQDSPFEAALRSNVNRVLKQEKQATRVDPAEAEERAQIRAQREAREREENAGRRLPSSLTNGVAGGIQDSVVMAFRRAQRREAEEKATRMPSLPVGSSLDEKVRAAMDWDPLPTAEKRLVRGAHDTVKGERAAAESLGLSYAEAKSAETAKRIEVNDALSPLLTEWERSPAETFVRFGRQHGLLPEPEVARQRAQAARESALMRGIQSVVDDFARRTPDFAEHEGVMQAGIASGLVARTGHVATDLRNAYHFARSGGVTSVIESYASQRPDFDALQPMMEAAITNGWVARSGNVLRDLDAAYTFARSHYA